MTLKEFYLEQKSIFKDEKEILLIQHYIINKSYNEMMLYLIYDFQRFAERNALVEWYVSGAISCTYRKDLIQLLNKNKAKFKDKLALKVVLEVLTMCSKYIDVEQEFDIKEPISPILQSALERYSQYCPTWQPYLVPDIEAHIL